MPFDLGTISFALASVSFFALLLAQLRIWETGKSSFVLLVATIVTIIWSVALLAQSSFGNYWFYIIPLLEVIKNISWFVFLLSILGARNLVYRKSRNNRNSKGLIVLATVTLGVPLVLLIYQLVYRYWQGNIIFFPTYGGQLNLLGFLVTSIAGLTLLEQVIRNTRAHLMWHLKYICLGLGILFSFDVYIYSEALLFNRVDVTFWQVRGMVIAVSAPLIAVGAVRTRQQPIQLNISRRLVLHSGVLIVAGLYLLVMASAGYYIRNISGEWGTLLRVLFWIISLSLLMVLAFSGRVRNLIWLYINRNLFSSKFDYREQWTKITQTLSSTESDEALPDRAIHALANIVGSSAGGLWLTRDGKHYEQAAQVEFGWIEQSEVTEDDYLIRYLEESNQLLDLEKHRKNYDLAQLPTWLLAVNNAWLVIPLALHGKLIGFIVLKKPNVNVELNWEDFDLFNAAGQQTASYLAQMIAADALSEAQQFTAFNQGSAFVVHDIKTLNSQLSMLVRNAEKHKDNPAFIEDMIKTTEHAVQKMDFLLNHFRGGGPTLSEDSKGIDLVILLKDIISSQSKLKPVPRFETAEDSVLVAVSAFELKSGITHLIQNAQDATPDEGEVVVQLRTDRHNALIDIRDTGSGMTAEFIQTQLFKPFQSTKGLTGMGVGAFQSRESIRNLGGNLEVKSSPGVGTEFKITIPIFG